VVCAAGIDRIVMLLQKRRNIREVHPCSDDTQRAEADDERASEPQFDSI